MKKLIIGIAWFALAAVAIIYAIKPDLPKQVIQAIFGAEIGNSIAHPREDGLDYLYDPVQKNTTGETTIQVGKLEYRLKYVAEYGVAGKVLGTNDYSGSSYEDKISPRDVALAWGWLTEEGSDNDITWGPYGNRGFNYTLSPFGTADLASKVRINTSNNHLIPENDDIKKLIKDIQEGDYVRIDGYLVNASCELSGGRTWVWKTSTSRDDYDCELIYVTNVTWLQESRTG